MRADVAFVLAALVLAGCVPRPGAEVRRADRAKSFAAAERSEAEQAATRWREGGARGLEAAAQALCGGSETQAVQDAAVATLKAAGLASVPALAAAVSRRDSGVPPCWLQSRLAALAADLLCAAPADAEALGTAVRGLPRREGPEGTFAEAVLLDAVGRRGRGGEARDCPAHPVLARLLVREVLRPAALGRRDPQELRLVLVRLGGIGPEGAALVPLLAQRLSDGDAGLAIAAAKVLASVGPAARDATPAIERAMTETARWLPEGVQQRSEMHDRKELLVALVSALGAIGEPAAGAASSLVALMHAELAGRGLPSGAILIAVARALPRLAPRASAEIVPDLAALLRYRVLGEAAFPLDAPPEPCIPYHGMGCPPPPRPSPGRWLDSDPTPRRHTGPPADVTWQALVDAVAGLGPPAASVAPLLSRLMLDAAVDLHLRIASARALARLGIEMPVAERAIHAQLVRRGEGLDRLSRRLDRHQYTQSALERRREAPRFAAEALQLCVTDAVDPGAVQGVEAQLATFSDAAAARFDRCVNDRLCGPGPEERRAVVRVCCDYAYLGAQPPMCAAGLAAVP